ncbi:MAG: ATP-grasp domain-containing protein [Candidatus Dormibacteria bacterium]
MTGDAATLVLSAGGQQAMAALAGARVLLLIPARTYRAADFVSAARRLGIDLVVGSDGALSLVGEALVHVTAGDLAGSTDRLVERSGAVDAVIAADNPMLILAAATSVRMGLPTNSVAAVTAATDKAIQRELWAEAGTAQPAFRVIRAGTPGADLVRAAEDVGFPCVVKAVSLSASQGVLRAENGLEALKAATQIRRILTRAGRPDSEPLVVEEYVPGWELSIDGLLVDGELTVTAVFDKPDSPEGPTFEETVLVTPSRLDAMTLAAAEGTAAQAARALGLERGPIHAELRIDSRDGRQRPTMIELAARSIGGLCSRALRFLDGVSLEELVFANALGQRIAAPRIPRPTGVLMIPVETCGTLRAVEGREAAHDVPGITGVSITIPIGDAVRPLPDGDRYLGFLFAEGETHAEVEDALRAARRQLRVVVDPVAPRS